MDAIDQDLAQTIMSAAFLLLSEASERKTRMAEHKRVHARLPTRYARP
jgi:hypothetical protein